MSTSNSITDRKPRILFVLHLPPPVHGATMVGQFIRDSKLVNDSFECRYMNCGTARSIEDMAKAGVAKAKTILEFLVNVRDAVKSFSPDLVYVTPNASGPAFYKDGLAILLLKAMGCKVVLHYHNKGIAEKSTAFIPRQICRMIFRNTGIILLSDMLKKDISAYADELNIQICPNGIPDRACIQEHHSEIPRLLFLSNLIETKGVGVLMRALKILLERGCKFSCDLVGGETADYDTEKISSCIIDQGLQNHVRYLGRKTGEEKDRILDGSDIFVFPTYYDNECFPLVLLEAMSHGLPCVSTPEGAIPAIIDDGQTGLIVEKKDPVALADAIEKLLRDKSLGKEMGRKGREKYEREFTLEAFEANFINSLKYFLR